MLEGKLSDEEIRELWAEHYPKALARFGIPREQFYQMERETEDV